LQDEQAGSLKIVKVSLSKQSSLCHFTHKFLLQVPKHSLIPTLTSLAVCTLLSEQAPLYVNAEFTSEMEKTLDYIASNDGTDRNLFLKRYHEELNQFVEQVMMAPDDSSRQARLPLLEGSNVEVLVSCIF